MQVCADITVTVYSLLVIMVITAIFQLIIVPLVFNFKIIPGIEWKIGKRLAFTLSMYNLFFLRGYFARYAEIAIYIFIKSLKIPKKNPPGYALEKVKYSREQFSKLEIFWSFLYIFTLITFCVSFAVVSYLCPDPQRPGESKVGKWTDYTDQHHIYLNPQLEPDLYLEAVRNGRT